MDGTRNFNKISIGSIRCVAEIMRRKSIKDAARFLNISQPAASQHLKRFEEAIGYPVVLRVGNEIVVRGEEAIEIISEIENAASALGSLGRKRGDRKWKPSLGISSDFIEGCIYDLRLFNRLSGQYNISFLSPDETLNNFKNGHIDAAFGFFPKGELDCELSMVEKCQWMGGYSYSIEKDSELKVLSGLRGSIWDSYICNYLESEARSFSISMRVASIIYAMKLSASGIGLTPVASAHKELAEQLRMSYVAEMPNAIEVEYGLLVHSKAIPSRNARGIFEQLARVVFSVGSS